MVSWLGEPGGTRRGRRWPAVEIGRARRGQGRRRRRRRRMVEPPVVLIFLIVRPSAVSLAATQIAPLSSCSHLNPGPGSHLELNINQIKPERF